jgi:hypothetical protein
LGSKPISGIISESQQISGLSYKQSQLSLGIWTENSQPNSGKYRGSGNLCRHGIQDDALPQEKICVSRKLKLKIV